MYIYSVEEKNNVESFFKNIAIKETINYGTEQIYVVKKLTPICSKQIFRRLLVIIGLFRLIIRISLCYC